ncbi:Swt1 family HEPN domain-containing protein [Bosea sp. Tri-44]|uniref:Swt1 family HEPN domain-containing protein n=1 Tax=Bosea sp. Tri-44 TaxID=1972137 RepID=UPI00100EDDAF|nr:Swt1 family HEPN domain-containing protein [Bosea sp. Tri-44]
MTEERDIELFVLKNAAMTRSLRQIFNAENIGNSRGALEAQADSLVSDYLKQVDFKVLVNAKRMSEFYMLFYALENDIRDLIESTLIESFGDDWWGVAVPQFVRDNVQKNYDREAAEGLPPRSDRMIDYSTFGELGEIVKENWEIFSGMFSNATRNRVLRLINRLNLVRGPIAHCNLLPEEEAIRLKLAIRDWYKLME